MVGIEIRPLEPHDARAVFDLSAHPEVARALGGTPLDAPHAHEQRFRASIGPPGVERLGAFAGGELVGVVEIARGGRARVSHAGDLTLAVHPAHRRRGIGSALLDALLDAADRWMHLVRLEVEVLAGDAAAQRLLEGRGFVAESRRRGAIFASGALADTVTLGRIRPGFVQPEGALRRMPAPPPRRAPRGAIVVRPVTLDDAPSLARFSRDETILLASSQVPTMGVEHWRRRIESWATSWSAAAVVDGEIAACGTLFSAESPRRRHAVTLALSVAAEYQGLGIGDRMMHVLLETASQWLGAERVELMVLADNARAVRLYEKHGFEREGLLRLDIWRDGGYADSLRMSRLYPRSAAPPA
jgi:L-phenylalanine/L-methionine N-acetyltransferase